MAHSLVRCVVFDLCDIFSCHFVACVFIVHAPCDTNNDADHVVDDDDDGDSPEDVSLL